MGDFSHLEERMGRNVGQLHDFLWRPGWNGDDIALREELRADARELDAFLGAGGSLERSAEALTEDWGRNREAEMLFELLHHAYDLTAATEFLKRGEFSKAAAHANEAAESVSIGICANAGCFPLVEQWEGGEIDFATYTRELAAALAAKDLAPAEDFRRMLMAVQGLGKEWDGGGPETLHEMAARATIENALWVAAAGVSLRQALGTAPDTPYGTMPDLFLRIAARI